MKFFDKVVAHLPILSKNSLASLSNWVLEKVSPEDISKLRNDSGAKYYICEKCGGGTRDVNVVYITKYGTRYHKDINCSELKRGVLKVKPETVKDRKPCSKCGEGK